MLEPSVRRLATIVNEAFNPDTKALRLELVPSGLQTTSIDTFQLFDDFFDINTTRWVAVTDGATGTLASATLPGGWINIPSAGADNDYHLLRLATLTG